MYRSRGGEISGGAANKASASKAQQAGARRPGRRGWLKESEAWLRVACQLQGSVCRQGIAAGHCLDVWELRERRSRHSQGNIGKHMGGRHTERGMDEGERLKA